jgi:cation diffusion facilitator CzcD-associated flavoprotein CzcO
MTPPDPSATTASTPGSEGSGLRFLIIGAGMAGLLAGIRLKQRGDDDFVIYEKGEKVGGTWRENHYPGLSCDTPAHEYTYSFAPNPEWSAHYAPGPEIQRYFEAVTDRYGIRDSIRFRTEIASCRYEDGRWRVRTTDGHEDVADVVVAATGVLHHPNIPDIPGLETFDGPWFHSARWVDSVRLDGRRLGVIGAGSTGVQIVSALADRVERLVHIQRSAQWIMPCIDRRYTDAEKQAFRDDPAAIEAVRHSADMQARRDRFTRAVLDVDSPQLAEIHALVEKNLEESVRDPVLRETLRPKYRAACKRLIFAAHYYDAVQKPNVAVSVGAIERIEPNGVRMADGVFHKLDVLALATGFKADQFVRPMKITGRGGVDLDAVWAVRPKAHYAMSVPDFPNFFLLNGPSGPVGNFSLIDIAERQWGYIDQLLDLVRQGRCRGVAPRPEALADYEVRRAEAAKRTVFASGCKSWYLDAEGVPQTWPWSYERFAELMAKPQLEEYELVA